MRGRPHVFLCKRGGELVQFIRCYVHVQDTLDLEENRIIIAFLKSEPLKDTPDFTCHFLHSPG